jgi:hypothetical protein
MKNSFNYFSFSMREKSKQIVIINRRLNDRKYKNVTKGI